MWIGDSYYLLQIYLNSDKKHKPADMISGFLERGVQILQQLKDVY